MPLDAALAFLPASTLAAGLRRRDYSCRELADFFLERLTRLGPHYNAVVTVLEERARKQCEALDAEAAVGRWRGPLHGVPYAAKDLLDVAGAPTTWGAEPFRKRIPTRDAAVVERLDRAGAVLVGKLAMVEIAGGLGYEQADASFTGPGLNPWNREHWSGGSSSGCGSAVAAGLVPFAIGSETWGSIVTPSAYCGVTGLRPTYGRVSLFGAMALSWSMDKLGPMARTALDAAVVLEAIAGPDARDPANLSEPFQWKPERPQRKLRIGVIRDPVEFREPSAAANVEAAIALFEEVAELVEVEPPSFPSGAAATTIISCEAAAAFGRWVDTGEVWGMTAPEDRIGLHAGLRIPAVDYIQAQRIRRKVVEAMAEWMAGFDVLMSASIPAEAPPATGPFEKHFARWSHGRISGLGNLAGLPAVAAPCGFGPKGMPHGVQWVGGPLAEEAVLQAAAYFQSRTDWHAKTPPPPAGPAANGPEKEKPANDAGSAPKEAAP